jgi:spore cortex formation protein SpoVR/YcgB (stage V sporulation)
MQMMVVAHASYGHNSFFKNNHMFERFTQAKDILGHLLKLKNYVRECEDKYGYEEVEKVIDACHALETHGVDRYKKPQKRTPEEAKAKRERIEEARRQSVDRVMDTTLVKKKKVSQPFSVAAEEEPLVPKGGEENLLRYIATYAPHLPHWKRNIINMIADKAQYFYPQRQTQAMNEGWASFWHYTIMNDLYDLDLIDNGMMADFIKFHTNVLAQPDYDDKRFSGINPYFVGFRIYQDIKRICMEPTEEDKEWAPEIAGNGDWLNTLKEAMEDYKDESFFLQFLSPKLIRDLRLFALQNDSELSYYEITGIHNEKGYDHVRRVMASNYRLADNEPRIEVVDYNYRGDRTLTLLHSVYRGRPIEREDMSEILKHMYQLWEHPVVLESRDPDGKLVNGMSCPPGKAKPGSLEYSSEFGF